MGDVFSDSAHPQSFFALRVNGILAGGPWAPAFPSAACNYCSLFSGFQVLQIKTDVNFISFFLCK